jgi:hypothetical protein
MLPGFDHTGSVQSVRKSLNQRRTLSVDINLLAIAASLFLMFKVNHDPLPTLLEHLHAWPKVGRERELFLCLQGSETVAQLLVHDVVGITS